jgi:hypothetical protein
LSKIHCSVEENQFLQYERQKAMMPIRKRKFDMRKYEAKKYNFLPFQDHRMFITHEFIQSTRPFADQWPIRFCARRPHGPGPRG